MKRILPPPIARLVMALASLVGLFASGYLLYTYVTGAPITCGLVSGCEVVRASKWAYTWGIPRPLLGLIFYVGVFGLLVARVVTSRFARRFYHLTMLAAAVGFFESAFLFLVQWLDLKAFCLWCLTSAVAATVVALCAPFDRVETERRISTNRELKYYFLMLLAFVPVSFIGFAMLVRPKATPVPTPTQISAPVTLTPADVLLREDTPTTGAASSSVLFVEFGDFQCPACGAFHPTMLRLRQEYGTRVRFAFRNFPLVQLHAYALHAASAGYCANKQGKFWEFNDLVYLHQDKLTDSDLLGYVKQIGLNIPQYQLCINDSATSAAMARDLADAKAFGLNFTPSIFINRLKIEQALPYEDLKKLIDQELSKSF